MNERKVCEILKLANAGPALFLRDDFFAVKEHLLKHFATSLGPCWQRITKRCWGVNGLPCDRQKWCSCVGTGLYSDVFVVHEGFEWYGAKFLVPRNRVPAKDHRTVAGHEVPYPLPRKTCSGAGTEASIALVEAFTEQIFDHGDRYTVSRMRVAMGQIPRRLIEFPVEIPFYGYFTGGDPRQFTPDRDMCSQAEIDNHDAACRRWNEAEQRGVILESEPCPSGRTADSAGNVIHVLCTPYGIGVTLP